MKKILVSMFLLVFGLCLFGCTKRSDELGSGVPYGNYDDETMHARYPIFMQYDQTTKSKPEFSFKHTFKDGVFSTIENLEDIKCSSLTELFNYSQTEEELLNNYYALYFTRQETCRNDKLANISFYDLFIENGEIYVTIFYNDYSTEGLQTISYYPELILIPKQWKDKINTKTNFKINYNFENFNTMSYQKMLDFKFAYREQILKKSFDDYMDREIYIVKAYGEYNNCFIACATFDRYFHDADVRTTTEIIEGIEISYNYYYPIWVLHDRKLYTFTEAYHNGYLSIDDIKNFKKNYYGTFTENDLSYKLTTKTRITTKEQYEFICDVYNLSFNHYYVIDNYDDYIRFYSGAFGEKIHPLDEEQCAKVFEDNVIICFARRISGVRYYVDYYYDAYLRSFCWQYGDPNIDYIDYYDVLIHGYCIDMVCVPREYMITINIDK